MKDSRHSRLLFLAVLMCGFFYSSLVRISGVVVLPPLASSLGLSASSLGFISSMFFYTYGIGYGVWGVLIDRHGTFCCCGVSFLAASAGSFIMMSSASVLGMSVGRALAGIGLSSMYVGMLSYCSRAFPIERYAFYSSITMFTGSAGTMAAVAPLGALLDTIGPRGTLFFLGVAAGVIGLTFLLNVKNEPMGELEQSGGAKHDSISGCFKEVWNTAAMCWHNYPLRTISMIWAAVNTSMQTLQALWGVAWLQSVSSVSVPQARLCLTFVSIGLTTGPLAGGAIIGRCRGGKSVLVVSNALILAAWAVWLVSSAISAPIYIFGAAAFTIGFCNAISTIFMSKSIQEIVPDRNASTLGFANMLSYAFIVVFQWGSGVILDRFPHAGGVYSEKGFLISFLAILAVQFYSFTMIFRVDSFSRGKK